MIRPLVTSVAALLASAGAALAQTEVITGDQGFDRQELRGATLYDALDATVHVTQGRNNTCYVIRPSSPSDAVFLGGRCLGEGANRTLPWRDLYDLGNGASVRFEGSPNLTVRHHFSEFAWDPIKPATGSGNWTVEESWIKDGRDDCIEADHAGAHDGVVRRSFLQRCHTFLSVTPGSGQAILERLLVEFEDNLMSLGCGLDDNKPCEDRDKRLKFAWARPGGSGQAFKVRGCGDEIDILFRGNVVMMETGLNTGASNLPFFQCMHVQPGSTDNTFYWLGGCDFRGLEMTTLHGACVPKAFQLDPAVFTRASNDRAAWEAEVARWRAAVWEGVEAPLPSPPDVAVSELEPAEVIVGVDVRPQQCPNRVRADKRGTLPVAITGTDTFDVRDIDPKSIRLAGVSPKHRRTRFKDLASPFEPFVGNAHAGDCTREGADGFEDLLLRFSNRRVGRALGPVANGSAVVVVLTGELEDGTPIRGEAVIVVLN